MKIIDRTPFTASILQTRNRRNIFSGGNPSARRNVGTIDAIILHQTGFVSSNVTRLDYVIANYVIMQDGQILKLRDLEMALNSIGTNQRAIDIEFVGDYPNARALRSASALPGPSLAQLGAGRWLICYLKSLHGVSNIYAHAQFTPKNCPGPQIWYNVGEWAIRNGLRSVHRGRPIDPRWQASSLAATGLIP